MNAKVRLSIFARLRLFIRQGIWDLRPNDNSGIIKSGIYLLRLVLLIASGFKRNQCALHAASLTFFSLMSLIPVLAMTLAMARAFGGAELAKEQINKQLDNWMVQMEQAAEVSVTEAQNTQPKADVTKVFSKQVREVADKLFEQIDGLGFGTLGGIGAVMLLWMVISVLGKVESSFNQVWGVAQPRTLVRKFADYLAVIMLLPFLITAASTVPVAAMAITFMDQTVGGTASTAFRSLLHSGLFKTSVTLVTGTLTFAFLLGFMPNARVKLIPALVGGFVTVVLFAVWFKLCAMLQIGIAKYSVLYGSFAVLPILLMWVCTSWQILLLGSEIAFAIQNGDNYKMEQNAVHASSRTCILLALTLCAEAARRAGDKNGAPFAAYLFAKQHGISNWLVRNILETLVRNRIFAEVTEQRGMYLLCRCGEKLTVSEIMQTMLDEGEPSNTLGLETFDMPVITLNKQLNEILSATFSKAIAHV